MRVDEAVRSASEAFDHFSRWGGRERAALLRDVARRIAALGDRLVTTTAEETALGPDRVRGERDRTVAQWQLFADLSADGAWLEAVIVHGDPDRRPRPRPDLRRMLRPLGPVAVFGASNFPLAYGAGGGDTASALAAGCPVVVKAHEAQPRTSSMVAEAIGDAVRGMGAHPGVYSLLTATPGEEFELGTRLVAHAGIRAVGFTGSVSGGTALMRVAQARPEPIPVFAEMGSVNPVFILPKALARDAEGIAATLAASATDSTGQMCTCPGLLFVLAGADASRFAAELASRMSARGPMPMLSSRTKESYLRRQAELRAVQGVETLTPEAPDAGATPMHAIHAAVLRTCAATFGREATLREECFGPGAVIVECESPAEFERTARRHLPGSLTATVIRDEGEDCTGLFDALSRVAGRVIVNGVPTGVEVCDAIVHSGPFPACGRPETSAVGPLAIRRWCRPVAYQGVPDALLPPELQESNPHGIERLVDGSRTR